MQTPLTSESLQSFDLAHGHADRVNRFYAFGVDELRRQRPEPRQHSYLAKLLGILLCRHPNRRGRGPSVGKGVSIAVLPLAARLLALSFIFFPAPLCAASGLHAGGILKMVFSAPVRPARR